MLWNKQTTKKIGDEHELLACHYLERQGLTIIEQNFHSRGGELDIIAQESNTLVFVEVKYRKNKNYGGAISAISPNKQEKIRRTAQYYMQQAALNEYNTACRFDVIAIEGCGNKAEFNWLKNAF